MLKSLKNRLLGLLTGIYYPLKERYRRVAYYLGNKLARLAILIVIAIIAIVAIFIKLTKLTKKFTRKRKKGKEDSV